MPKLLKPVTRTDYEQLAAEISKYGSVRLCAEANGMARSTVQEWVLRGQAAGYNMPSRRLTHATTGTKVPQDTVRELQGLLKAKAAALESAEKKLGTLKMLEEHADKVETPSWVRTKHDGKVTGVPQLLLSDLHWGEVVDPSQVGGVNMYNLDIAEARLRKCVETTISLLKDKIHGQYPGIVVALGGDMFDGFSLGHLELLIKSDADILESFLRLQAALTWAIKTLADEFGHVFVPSVVGNHPRLALKPQAKGAVKNNLDWLLAKQLEIHFKDDPRVQFHIPNSLDCFYQVYGKTYCLTHGDQFKGGSGIAGIWSALMLGMARKLKRQQAVGRPFDYLCMGHWHQLTLSKGLIVNGSTVGYDEYAYKSNFSYEAPAQALWINHPTYDLTHWLPVYLEESKKKSDDWIKWAK